MPRIVRFHEKGGPEVLRIEEVETAPPGPGELQIAVKAIGLNRAESMFRSGPYVEEPVFPARLGYEAAGIVTALGQGVEAFREGDAISIVPPLSITRWGSYGEVATVPAAVAVKHPAELSFIEAAALWMAHVTAYGALVELAGLKAGEHVLITAASSSVGIASIQAARAIGTIWALQALFAEAGVSSSPSSLHPPWFVGESAEAQPLLHRAR